MYFVENVSSSYLRRRRAAATTRGVRRPAARRSGGRGGVGLRAAPDHERRLAHGAVADHQDACGGTGCGDAREGRNGPTPTSDGKWSGRRARTDDHPRLLVHGVRRTDLVSVAAKDGRSPSRGAGACSANTAWLEASTACCGKASLSLGAPPSPSGRPACSQPRRWCPAPIIILQEEPGRQGARAPPRTETAGRQEITAKGPRSPVVRDGGGAPLGSCGRAPCG